jgi:hypothetical protein
MIDTYAFDKTCMFLQKISPTIRDATHAIQVKHVIFSRGQYTQKLEQTTVLTAAVIPRILRKGKVSSYSQHH